MIELISIIAVWRLTHLLKEEAGPNDILYRVREPFLEDGDPDGRPKNWTGDALKCFLCLSIWCAIPFAIIVGWHNPILMPVYWFGFSGGAIFMNNLYEVSNDKS